MSAEELKSQAQLLAGEMARERYDRALAELPPEEQKILLERAEEISRRRNWAATWVAVAKGRA